MKRASYQKLVQVFYSNATIVYQGNDDENMKDHDDSFITLVSGMEIFITQTLLQKILKLKPTNRDAITHINEKNAISEEELKGEFLVGPITFVKYPNSNTRLDVNEKILHLLVAQILRPFNYKSNTVTFKDMWFMHHIKRCTPIELAHFVYRDMELLSRGKRNNLPYGMAISEILEKMKIDTSVDKPIMAKKVNYLD